MCDLKFKEDNARGTFAEHDPIWSRRDELDDVRKKRVKLHDPRYCRAATEVNDASAKTFENVSMSRVGTARDGRCGIHALAGKPKWQGPKNGWGLCVDAPATFVQTTLKGTYDEVKARLPILGQVTLDEILEGLWIDFIKPSIGANADTSDQRTFDRVFKSKPHVDVHRKCIIHWKGLLGIGQREAVGKKFKEDIASLSHPSMAKWWYAFAVESGFMPEGLEGIVSMSVANQRSKAETTREGLVKQNRKRNYHEGLLEASTRELQNCASLFQHLPRTA